MGENKKERKTVWIYAVILFTSAFIVLLLTAYSQIKFNRNIDEYRNQLSSEAKEKSNFQMNLNQAMEVNKKLSEELKAAKEELNKKNSDLSEAKIKNSELESKYSSIYSSLDLLFQAQNEYDQGNIVNSADILYKLKGQNTFQAAGQERYNYLVEKTFKRAAYQLYIEGYQNYIEGKYDIAIQKLQQSFNLESNEYYSDDCLYFIAYSGYRSNNYEIAHTNIDKLLKGYPNSNYAKDAGALLKLLK